jgi:hypothetical protein
LRVQGGDKTGENPVTARLDPTSCNHASIGGRMLWRRQDKSHIFVEYRSWHAAPLRCLIVTVCLIRFKGSPLYGIKPYLGHELKAPGSRNLL